MQTCTCINIKIKTLYMYHKMEKKKRIILPNLGAVLWETINLIPHLKVKVLLSSSEAVKAKMNENLKIWDCKSPMKSDQKRSENVYTNILGRLLAIPCNWNIFCFLYHKKEHLWKVLPTYLHLCLLHNHTLFPQLCSTRTQIPQEFQEIQK